MFGSVLGVSTADMWLIIAVAAATLARRCVVFYRPLLFTTFDPEVADVSGVQHRPLRRSASCCCSALAILHDHEGPRRAP